MSPPVSGPVITLSNVVLGGWSSYIMSECQSLSMEKAAVSGRRNESL